MANVEISTITDTEASAAKVLVELDEEFNVFYATGSSKRHPVDNPRNGVGESLALARALRKVAEDLETWAWENLKPADEFTMSGEDSVGIIPTWKR